MAPLYGHSQHPRSPSLLPPRVLATSPQPPSLSSPVLYLKSHLISLFYIGISYIFILTSPQSPSQSHNRLISPSQPESNSSPHHNPRHHPLPHPTYIIIPTRLCHHCQKGKLTYLANTMFFSHNLTPGRQRPNYALPFPALSPG